MFVYYATGGFVIKKCMPDFEWLWSTSSKLDSKFVRRNIYMWINALLLCVLLLLVKLAKHN
eukprot:COSAG05_NODE_11487_length_511_cov_0.752427_1_plen_60_part_10